MPYIVSTVIAGITALALTVLFFIFIYPEKKGQKLKKIKIVKIVADIFTFKDLLLDKILTALYVFSTLSCIVTGILYLISCTYYTNWYGELRVTWLGGYGILILLGGPIAVRIAFEIIMMFVLLVKNTISINNKLSKLVNDKEEIVEEKEEPKKPSYVFCTHCGTQYDENRGKCPNGCQD